MHPAQSRSFLPSIASGTPSNLAHRGGSIRATQHTNTIFHPAHAGGAFLLPCIRHGAGLLFLPIYNTATYKRLQLILSRPCNYTVQTEKPFTGLYSGVSVDLTYSSPHNAASTQAGYTPPAPRRRAYRQSQRLAPIPDTTVTPGRCTGQHSRPIIIRYIRGCSISQTIPARRGQLLPSADPLASATPGAPAEGSASPPVQGQPGGVSILPMPGGWRSGTGSAIIAHRLAPFTRRGSPVAGARRTARNH